MKELAILKNGKSGQALNLEIDKDKKIRGMGAFSTTALTPSSL